MRVRPRAPAALPRGVRGRQAAPGAERSAELAGARPSAPSCLAASADAAPTLLGAIAITAPALAHAPFARAAPRPARQTLTTAPVAGISSPVPTGAMRLKGGGRRITLNGIQVTILPDAASRDRALAGRAHTTIRYDLRGLGYRLDRKRRVTRFTPPQISATIRTTYGPGTSAASPSAYGRGTTAADIAAGTTTLGFHESRHGLDFLEALDATPLPIFTGAVGQTEADFRAARAAFAAQVAAHFAAIEHASEIATDCVGITIDQHNAQQGVITAICPVAPAPAAGGGSP